MLDTMIHMKKTTLRIPFCGFYESEADFMIQQEIEQSFDTQGTGEPEVPDEFWVHWGSNHKDVEVAFAKHYTELFQKYFKDITGIELTLFFEELDSPKFYNYETDKIYCRVKASELRELWDLADKEELNRTIKDFHSHREGFVSAYSNELNKGEWLKPVEEWDLNQLHTLLCSILRQYEVEEINYYDMFEDSNCNGEMDAIVWNNCSKECLDMINSYDKEQRA